MEFEKGWTKGPVPVRSEEFVRDKSPFRVVVGDREWDEKCAEDSLLQQRDMGNSGPSLGGTRLFRPVIALSGANPLILSVMSCM